jgi:HEPN domain-containing protein
MKSHKENEARRWFHQASYDLKAARWNIQGGFNDTACFLAQQSAEKALKSLHYYIRSSRHRLLTHSIVEMLQTAGRKVENTLTLLEDGRELDLHYIPARYPNGLPSGYPHKFYGKETAQKAIAAAERIFEFVTSHLREKGEIQILEDEE